jgi:glycosyltransferase involved in cell wall biosynthesis
MSRSAPAPTATARARWSIRSGSPERAGTGGSGASRSDRIAETIGIRSSPWPSRILMPVGDGAGIGVSVIVPAYRADHTLALTLDSLLAQTFSRRFEVIVVASADSEAQLPELPSHASLRSVTRVPRVRAAAARNLGVSLACGAALAFTDADVIAAHDWLERLSGASAGRWCVAGSVANGTPSSAVGTAEYLVEFFDLSPARTDPPNHGATCNLLVPRALWDAYGPFPDGLNGCEDTWLTTRLFGDQLLRFAPDAVVHHLNRRRLSTVIRHQYALGAAHARLAAGDGSAPSRPLLTGPLRACGRIVYLYRMLARWAPRDLTRAVVVAPLVIAAFLAWGAGLTGESLRLAPRPPRR